MKGIPCIEGDIPPLAARADNFFYMLALDTMLTGDANPFDHIICGNKNLECFQNSSMFCVLSTSYISFFCPGER